MTVIGVILALIGPFGSFQDPLPLRLIVWLGFSYLGYALYAPIDGIVVRLAPALQLPEWLLRVMACLVATLPMAVAVYVLPRLPGPIEAPPLASMVTHYFYVLVIGGLVTATFHFLGRYQAQDGKTAVAPSPLPVEATDNPRFLDSLPPELGSDIFALEMEDHYVRVHTALGSDLVLMRMRDAVAELEAIEGMQVHRSWWVARGAVEDVKRDGRNLRLMLAREIEAPVSRANVAALKDAGWV